MRSMFLRQRRYPLLLAVAALCACGGGEPPAQNVERRVSITVATAAERPVQVIEESIGYIDTLTSPMVAAEVAGRLVEVAVEVGQAVEAGDVLARVEAVDYQNELRSTGAETARLEALLENQRRVVARYRSLGKDRFVSETALDEAESQLKALTEQLSTARARRDIAARGVHKTVLLAPVDGVIQQRLVSKGTYVNNGQALFQIATRAMLRVHLPLPETVLGRLRPGLTVHLTTPTAPGQRVTSTVTELRPMVSSATRAGEAIVELPNPGDWAPGASVTGRLVMEERNSVVVPAISIILRPAGTVAYVVDGDKVRQAKVEVGERLGDELEIRSGLSAGQRVAADGAAYLADGAAITVREQGR
ncbi:MAG: efflux RND transporter periplasmic adaptor subunit [Immundisolibacter sp.]|uniref:efflux RND transporter periplasmic adaptor subunit n=1 Tax=Immundisolibacter sp. TaxID=1934948 RepID=UPI003EE2BD4F